MADEATTSNAVEENDNGTATTRRAFCLQGL